MRVELLPQTSEMHKVHTSGVRTGVTDLPRFMDIMSRSNLSLMMDSEIAQLRDRRREIERVSGRARAKTSEQHEIAQVFISEETGQMRLCPLRPCPCNPLSRAASGGSPGTTAKCSAEKGGPSFQVQFKCLIRNCRHADQGAKLLRLYQSYRLNG